MNEINYPALVQGLLFSLGRPQNRNELCKKLQISTDILENSLDWLKKNHSAGIVIVDDGTFVELRTAPEISPIIEKLHIEESSKELSRASIETLATILYKGSLARSEIDFIRGVNSSYIVRALLVKGYIRKTQNDSQSRSATYEPTTELLSFLGIFHISDLPDYDEVQKKLIALEESYKKTDGENTNI